MDEKIDELLTLMRKRIEDSTDDKYRLALKSVLNMLGKSDGNLKHRTQR